MRTYIKDLKSKVGEEITIAGFVHTIRDQGSIKFVLIRDVTGIIQVVVIKKETEVFELVSDLSTESVVKISGTVKEEEQAPEGIEVAAQKITVLSKAAPELPIPVVEEKGSKDVDITKRLDWRWIDLRKKDGLKIFKVWTSLERGMREYFHENGFIQIYPPSLMTAPSESGADVFEVEYFERKAYLAQSPQFYKQMAMAAGFERVFVVGPVFRAEPSFTTRHMTEFTGWDFEMSYINSYHDVLDEIDKFFVAAFQKVEDELGLGIEVPKVPFPRITMAEAKEKLKKAGVKSEKDYDVSPEEERKLSEVIKEETGSDFVHLTDYPIEARPFYHMRHEDNPKLTKSYDLIYKGLEVLTGAQREHRVDVLEKQAKEQGVDLEEMKGYFDFFRYGCPPHGGAGIGPGRIIMKMLDLSSVKEATFLPRDVKRLTP